MPELPEVEHAATTLRRWLRGRTIVRVEADDTRVLRGTERRALVRALRGRKLRHVVRHGKVLLLYFDGNVGLLSHLGMTGKWLRRRRGEAPPSHSRVRLFLAGGDIVHYRDPRLFGRMALHRAGDLSEAVSSLGPDPLVDGIDVGRLSRVFAKTSRAVKVVLLDQRVLAGVGNIHATEALFRARVHPARPARSLSRREVRALARGIEASLRHALGQIGDEEIVYVEEDANSNPFLVYDRAGTPCPRCRATLEKLTIGGRTSAFCPRCQRLAPSPVPG